MDEGTAGMPERNRLDESLRDIQELEEFSHRLIGHLAKVRPKAGEDVTRYAEELGLEIPAALKGAPITWERPADAKSAPETGRGRTVVLARPGNPEALGFVLGCIYIRHVKICLECGFWYCRIVVTSFFAQ